MRALAVLVLATATASAGGVRVTTNATSPEVAREVRKQESAFIACYGKSTAKRPAVSLIVTIDDKHKLTTSEVESYYNRPAPQAMLDCVAKAVLSPASVKKLAPVEAVVHVEYETD